MDWFRAGLPDPALAARLAFILAALTAVTGGVLWLFGEDVLLAAGGALLAGLAVWGLGRARRGWKRRQAERARPQAPPGTQPLRSEVGTPHWTDTLPFPLREIARKPPMAALAVGALGLAFVAGSLVASAVRDDSTVHVRLEEGAQGEIEPRAGRHSRMRVTILSIVDGAESPLATPPVGRRYWAVELRVEHLGTKEVRRPIWRLRDTGGSIRSPERVEGIGADLGEAFPILPGQTVSGWLVFVIDDTAGAEWLRMSPFHGPGLGKLHHLFFHAD